MAQLACVDVPALPLQLLLHDHPDWVGHPVAVVRDDRPQAEISWVNASARAAGILPGHTFAAGRSLSGHLRAGVVSATRLETACEHIANALLQLSPRVERDPDHLGVFFVDPQGLITLYGSLEQWAALVRQQLESHGYTTCIVLGFQRFRCYALARASHGIHLMPNAHTEAQLAARVRLDLLDLEPQLRDGLALLRVRTLGEFLALPAAELRLRFGTVAWQLHRAASDHTWMPLQPRALVDPLRDGFQLEPADADYNRLLFGLKHKLHGLLRRLSDAGKGLSALELVFELDHAPQHVERLEPAAPTLDVLTILDLVRLRLESVHLAAAVTEVRIEVEGIAIDPRQLALFNTRLRRDLEAANRSLARVRALLGPAAVSHASLRAAHLPEATFGWEATASVDFPRSDRMRPHQDPPLVRRLFTRPRVLAALPRHTPEDWFLDIPGIGSPAAMHGPYRISGGWWARTVERDYYYAETTSGTILWIYYDRPRRTWFLHGVVD